MPSSERVSFYPRGYIVQYSVELTRQWRFDYFAPFWYTESVRREKKLGGILKESNHGDADERSERFTLLLTRATMVLTGGEG